MDINFKKRAIAIILAFTMAAGTIYSSPLTSKEQTVASAKPGNKYKVNSYGILTSYSGGSDVYLNAKVSAIDAGVFDMVKVNSFTVSSNNKYLKAEDGVLYTKNGKKLVRCPSGRKGAFSVPGTVTSIAQNAFRGCDKITSIQIPESVNVIGSGAFYKCSKLEMINIPSQVTALRREMFYNCRSLESITLPSRLRILGASAFEGCYKISGINLPSSLEVLGNRAFYKCKSLKEISVPDRVKSVPDFCFSNCRSLENINFGTGIENINSYAFYKCQQLKKVIIPGSVNSVGSYAFKDCINLKDLIIHNGVSNIGSGVFMECTSLRSVKISDNIEYIGHSTFYGCSNLENVVLSKQLRNIPYNMFADCIKLKNASLPSGITTIENNAFKNCKSLTIVKIPQNTSFIGSTAFYNAGTEFLVAPSNKSFTSINGVLYNAEKTVLLKVPAYKHGSYKTPGTVNKISSYAFNGCQKLDKITIGEGIKKINKNSFNASSVKEISLPSTLKTLKNELNIIDTYNLTDITIPENNQYFSSVSGMLYSKDKSILYMYPAGRTGTVKFPKEVSDLSVIPDRNKAFAFSVATGQAVYSTDDGMLVTKEKTKIYAVPSARTSYKMGSRIKNIDELKAAKPYMENLKKITVNSQNKKFSSKDGVLMSKDYTKIILYPCAKPGRYKTPASVIKIDDNAFSGARKLTKLIIGKNTTECNINLENCTVLKDITVKEGDLRRFTIYNAGTLNLKKLILPTSLVYSGIYGYKGKLEDLTITGWTNTSAEKLAKKTGAQFISAGIIPKRVKNIKINAYIHPKRIKVSWKRDPQASGYEVYTENKKLKDIPDNKITETSLHIGRNYGIIIYIRAYKIQKGKKIYGKPGSISYYLY